MFTKEQWLESVETEISIIKHLASQLDDGHLEYKPTEAQRTTKELLQYLSFISATQTNAIINGDLSVFKENSAAASSLEFSDFGQKMDAEYSYIKESVTNLADEQLSAEVELFGVVASRGTQLVNFVLKHLVAYRMQLFLYAKHAGLEHLDTWDVWRGTSNPEKS